MALTVDCLKPIYPKYDYKYANKPKEICSTYLSSKNPFNLIPGSGRKKVGEQVPRQISGKLTTKDIDWKGKARSLFYHYTTGVPSVVCCHTTDACDEPPPVICRGRTRTRCTQTNYRESSAQTRPYQPGVAGDKENYVNYEVYQISKLLDGYDPPGEYEAKVVERARRRRQYQKALQLVLNDKEKHDTVLEAMEWEDWVAREEDIQGCQMLRMEIVERLFKERERKFADNSEKRIQSSSEKIHAKRAQQLKKINVEYARSIRRLEAEKQKISRKYRKGNIVEDHINPASDLHAPQMRFGVNPNRRHFVGFRKNFDDRIDQLDKRKDKEGLASLTCPFSKLRTWAKPKERVREVSQRFCSDENLKNLYESLKRLRTISEAPKSNPKCLKKKIKPVLAQEEAPSKKQFTISYRLSDEFEEAIEKEEEESEEEEEKDIPLTSEKLNENLHQRRQEELASKYKTEVSAIIGEFEGTTLGKLLQFLTDELERLKQQKKFHTIQMLAERERWKREAIEAGRRQKENKNREDHEELFAAASEVHKDTATLFLKSVLEEEFEFSAEAMATEQIVALARRIDKQDLECIKSLDKERRTYYTEVVSECVKNQVFDLAKKRLNKNQTEKMNNAQIRAIEEELFASVETALTHKYHTPYSVEIVGELLDEKIESAVIYDFDVISPEMSDEEEELNLVREIGEIIDKLVKLAVRYPGVHVEFLDTSEYETRLEAENEVAAIMRKLVRIAVPEERWKTQGERIVEETLSETFNGAIYEVECLKLARFVQCDDRLQEAIDKIYSRMDKWRDLPEFPIHIPASTTSSSDQSSYFGSGVKCIQSTIDLFDKASDLTLNAGSATEDFVINITRYVDPNELKPTAAEPVEIGRCHERFNILGAKVARHYRLDDSSGESAIYGSSSSTTSSTIEAEIHSLSPRLFPVVSRMNVAPWLFAPRAHLSQRGSMKPTTSSESDEDDNPYYRIASHSKFAENRRQSF